MNGLFRLVERIAGPLLRISLGLILLWIGALKFADPSPVVGLLHASLPFLALKGFVYTLGALEIAASFLLVKDFVMESAAIAMVALESMKVSARDGLAPRRVAA